MSRIVDIIQQVFPLPDAPLKLLVAQFSSLERPKGHLLLRPGRLESKLYFLDRGLARAYSVQNDQEITFWIGTEGAPLLSMRNYVYGQSSYEYLELLEESALFAIDIHVLKALFESDIGIANWGRAFAEQELIRTEERLISRQLRSAETRYLELMAAFPEIIRRVPLQYIASYLGITAVSLSRIRAGIAGA